MVATASSLVLALEFASSACASSLGDPSLLALGHCEEPSQKPHPNRRAQLSRYAGWRTPALPFGCDVLGHVTDGDDSAVRQMNAPKRHLPDGSASSGRLEMPTVERHRRRRTTTYPLVRHALTGGDNTRRARRRAIPATYSLGDIDQGHADDRTPPHMGGRF